MAKDGTENPDEKRAADRQRIIDENIRFLKKKVASIDSLLKSDNLSDETKAQLKQARAEVEELYRKARDPESYRIAYYDEKQKAGGEWVFNPSKTGIGLTDVQSNFKLIIDRVEITPAARADFKKLAQSGASLRGEVEDVFSIDIEQLATMAGESAKRIADKRAEESAIVKAQENQNQAKVVPVKGGGNSANSNSDPKEGDKRIYDGRIWTLRQDPDNGELVWLAATPDSQTSWAKTTNKMTQDDFATVKSEPLIETELNGKKVRYNPKDKTWYHAEQRKTRIGKGNKSPLSIPELIELRNQKEFRPYIDDQKIIDAGFKLQDTDVTSPPERGRQYIADTTSPNVPQRSTTSTGGRKGTGSGIVNKETPTRETPVTEGIATKGLTGEGLAGVLQRSSDRVDASMPDIKQGSVKEYVDTTGKGGGLKSALGKLSGLAEYAPDAFRMGLGLLGASEKVPEYEIPQEFMDYKSNLREMSTQGLSEQELANAYKDAERAYAYNVKGIRDMAGGRAGLGLANLGAATTNLGRAYEDINVADAAMRRQNLGMYGSALGTYIGLDRQQFEDKQQLALMNKQAGAQLAATALSDMQSRADYNKTYGKGSIYEDYMKQMVEGLRIQNEMYQYQLDNPLDIESMNVAPTSMPMTSQYPNFFNPYFQQPTNQ